MAIVTTDDRHYKAIADRIRELSTRYEDWDTFTPINMPSAIGSVYKSGITRGNTEGYNNGYEVGKEEGRQNGYDAGMEEGYRVGLEVGHDSGVQDEQDRFWDTFQSNGAKKPYTYAFYGTTWSDETYNPKYPFVTNSCNQMYYNNTTLTDTKMPIDISTGGQTYYLFQNASAMRIIRELIVSSTQSWSNFFAGCTSLESVRITGTVSKNISFADSPLNKETIAHLVGVLSSAASGQTITFKKSAKEAAFTDAEWNTLIATKPNWTFSLV